MIPSLMVFPALVLFAILIVEVAKLSQQKILMQFAMDTSVFMEASQASDMANRFAYLNSPWPTRVFAQDGGIFDDENEINPAKGAKPWHILCKNGVFPYSQSGEIWDGQFCHQKCIDPIASYAAPEPSSGFEAGWEQRQARCAINDTTMPDAKLPPFVIFVHQDFQDFITPDEFLVYEGGEISLWGRIMAVYGQLQTLADMVGNVYSKLHGVFFKKTFWLNTGFNPPGDIVSPQWFHDPNDVHKKTYEYYLLYEGDGDMATTEVKEGAMESPFWQLSVVQQLANDNEEKLHFGKYRYEGPPNSFGVSYRDLFNGMDPYVTASAMIKGGRIWPKPRPKFQVLLRP